MTYYGGLTYIISIITFFTRRTPRVFPIQIGGPLGQVESGAQEHITADFIKLLQEICGQEDN